MTAKNDTVERNLINRSDFLLIGILLILSFFILFAYSYYNKADSVKCEIIFDGKTVDVLDLSDSYAEGTFAFKENQNVKFEIRDNSIAFIESDCPDKICVKSGFLKYNGQMAACLPNRISIRIIAEPDANEADVDAVSE